MAAIGILRFSLLLAAWLAVALPALLGLPAASQQRPMTFLDIQHLRSAGGAAVSPDGRSEYAPLQPVFDTWPVFHQLGSERDPIGLLLRMDFLRDECDEWFGTNRPATRVIKGIQDKVQLAQQKLPPHALWLQRVTGMPDYARN